MHCPMVPSVPWVQLFYAPLHVSPTVPLISSYCPPYILLLSPLYPPTVPLISSYCPPYILLLSPLYPPTAPLISSYCPPYILLLPPLYLSHCPRLSLLSSPLFKYYVRVLSLQIQMLTLLTLIIALHSIQSSGLV